MNPIFHPLGPPFLRELLKGICLTLLLFIGYGHADEGKVAMRKQFPVSPVGVAQDIGLPALNWQMSPYEIVGLQQIKTDPAFGGIDQYTPSVRPLVFGDAMVNGWVFGFWQDQLYAIVVWADGQVGYTALRREAFERYGRGKQSISDPACFVWDGHDTQRMLKYDEMHQTAIFVMRSTLVDAHIKQLYPSE